MVVPYHFQFCDRSKFRCKDTGLKYASYVILNFRSAGVAFDGHPETLNKTDHTHKYRLTCYFKEIRMYFYGKLPINAL